MFSMLSYLFSIALLGLVPSVLAAFGFTESGGSYVVDAGSASSFHVSVNKANCDITSILYNGKQLQSPKAGLRTQVSSGLGMATVTAEKVGDRYIKVTCKTDTLVQYLAFVAGEDNIYLATHITAEPAVPELRFIARLDNSIFPSEYPFGRVSTTLDAQPGTSVVEGEDVFLVGGETRSKFYSSERFIDDHAHCVYGDAIHACMVTPQYETSLGGPFHRDIDSNNRGDYTSLYFYMNSNHVRTEPYRIGLHGPYAMTFRNIPKLSGYDFSFFSKLGIEGFVPQSGRGYVKGKAAGISSEHFQTVLHWFNSEAQYWCYASSDGSYTSPAMKPGTYTMKLYQTELEVASKEGVKVALGATTTVNIASTLQEPATRLWTIGLCDGQPTGFLNADKQLRMHPSDRRMAQWRNATFVVGKSNVGEMPMALFKGVNDGQTITFQLDKANAGKGATLRIRTTLAFKGGRPAAVIPNHWHSSVPPTPVAIDSRGVTRGAYRGLGEAYEFKIPDGVLVSGQNSIDILVVGEHVGGGGFLNPNFVLDCIELYR